MEKTSPVRQFALEIVRLLEGAGYPTRFVGGCVRDHLMGREPKDYDLASTALPDEMCSIFKQNNYKTLEVGKAFGTVMVIRGSLVVEVTTLRKDVEADGRHAKVKFTQSFAEDSARRDFTVNAMYEDSLGEVLDFHGGQEDIAKRALRFVGDSSQRVQEDYLRILRFYRFWSLYQLIPESDSRKACIQHKKGLKRISGERITAELSKILACSDIDRAHQVLVDDGIYEALFGARLDATVTLSKIVEVGECPVWVKRLAGLLYVNSSDSQNLDAIVERVGHRLKLSGSDRTTLRVFSSLGYSILRESFDSVSDSLCFLDNIQKKQQSLLDTNELFTLMECFADSEILQKIERLKEHADRYAERRSSFALSGDLLIKSLRLKASPVIGKLLLELKKSYYNGSWKTKQEGLDAAKELLKTPKFMI